MSHDENPYKPPIANAPVYMAEAAPEAGMWRKGKVLVFRKETILPDRCVKSNAATKRKLKRQLTWHHPAIFLTILISILVYAILALVLRKELQDRLERKGWRPEWADVIDDLDELLEMEISVKGKGYIVRSETKGVAGKVAQAAGVALPPVLRPLEPSD